MNYAIVMRGVPGSGKTTLARQIAGETGKIHSTYDYFYCAGIYRFDATRLADYHARNLEAFCESLRFEHPIVICDNTNVKKEHYILTFRPFFSEFRKFQLIEFLELMRLAHFWEKLTTNLLPKLQTTEEARHSVQLVNS